LQYLAVTAGEPELGLTRCSISRQKLSRLETKRTAHLAGVDHANALLSSSVTVPLADPRGNLF
jgi:hypothetical protein